MSLAEVQCHLDKEGASDLVIDLIMNTTSDRVFQESILLAIALLEGGNTTIQVSLSCSQPAPPRCSSGVGGGCTRCTSLVAGQLQFCHGHIIKGELFIQICVMSLWVVYADEHVLTFPSMSPAPRLLLAKITAQRLCRAAPPQTGAEHWQQPQTTRFLLDSPDGG